MLFNLTEFSNEPLHSQISHQIIEKIICGELDAGHLLEPVGTLATSHHVSQRTVKRAYQDLQNEGLVKADNAGNFKVAHLNAQQKQSLRSKQRVTASHGDARQFLSELELAQQMLVDLLPNSLPDNDQHTLAAYTSPSKTVGGDFYDYIEIDDTRFGLVIADVCGDGLPAAILAAQIQAMIKSGLNLCQGVQVTLEFLNRQINGFMPRNKFATLFFGMFNTASNKFVYASAGHNHPVLVRRDGSTEQLQISGPALGFAPDTPYATGEVELQQGDMIFCYTDGVTETMNPAKKEFGERRLLTLLGQTSCHAPNQVIDTVIEALADFQGRDLEQDDRTMMVLKVNEN